MRYVAFLFFGIALHLQTADVAIAQGDGGPRPGRLLSTEPEDRKITLPQSVARRWAGDEITLRLLRDTDNKAWILPVFLIKEATILDTMPGRRIVVTLWDVEADRELRQAIEAIVGDKAAGWAGAQTVGVDLIASRGARRLGTTLLARSVNNPEKTFDLPFSILDPSEELILQTRVSLPVRFEQADLDLQVGDAVDGMKKFTNLLSSNPNGEAATFIIPLGGEVAGRETIERYARELMFVKMYMRQGAEIDTAFLNRLLIKALTFAFERRRISDLEEKQIVTFLLNNRVRITGAVGRLKELNLEEFKQKIKQFALENQEKRSATTDIDSHYKGSVGTPWVGVGSDGALDYYRQTTSETFDSEESYDEDISNLQKFIKGDFPIPVLSADQIQTIANDSTSLLDIEIGTFQDGARDFEYKVSVLPGDNPDRDAQVEEHERVLRTWLIEKDRLANIEKQMVQLEGLENRLAEKLTELKALQAIVVDRDRSDLRRRQANGRAVDLAATHLGELAVSNPLAQLLWFIIELRVRAGGLPQERILDAMMAVNAYSHALNVAQEERARLGEVRVGQLSILDDAAVALRRATTALPLDNAARLLVERLMDQGSRTFSPEHKEQFAEMNHRLERRDGHDRYVAWDVEGKVKYNDGSELTTHSRDISFAPADIWRAMHEPRTLAIEKIKTAAIVPSEIVGDPHGQVIVGEFPTGHAINGELSIAEIIRGSQPRDLGKQAFKTALRTRYQVYAPPLVFGNWSVVGSHIGTVTVHLVVEPIGDTVVVGQVRYFNSQNVQVEEEFHKETTVSTGNSVANIEVRLKGTPTGSSCWVDVD